MTRTFNLADAQTNATSNKLLKDSLSLLASKLTNINTRLNELAVLSPRNEYFAGNAVCTSIGYTIINQMLWAYRKSQAALNTPAPSIDIFNDGFAEQYEQRASEANIEAIGMPSLPNFDAIKLIGVYKSMLYMQRGNTPFAHDFPVRMPNEILHEMQNREDDELLQKAYAAQTEKEIETSRAAHLIGAEIAKQAQAQKVRNEPKNKREMDHIMGELQRACPEQLTDDKWDAIPVWVQYKLSVSVFRQVVKAIAADTRTNAAGSATRDRLLALCDEMHLELESAAASTEVKLAFQLERLDERHEVVMKKVVKTVEA